MTDLNNRISSVGSGYSDDSNGRINRQQGTNDFEKLLRQQYARQQSRRAQAREELFAVTPGDAAEAVHFSKHALQRLEKRHIELGPEQNRRLESAVQAAAGKGVRQSLVFMDGIAFIVNVQDRVVVTALEAETNAIGASNTVFTNIDSAVFA
jgi:flagellar operon protein